MFAGHLRHVGRAYPADKHEEVVLLTDNAAWQKGKPLGEALAESPHLKLKRLPSYSPPLNPIKRFWKALRWRATHNRLFGLLAGRRKSLRASLCYFQAMRGRARALLSARKSACT